MSLFIENCSFFSSRDSHIGVILTREPLGNFKAVVIRAEKGGQRDALLSSESAETVQEAYELLLVKSADAVQNYITANGFEFAPSPKKTGNVVDDDDDGVSSVSSASEVMDGDLDKDLGDSTLSFDAESAYESMTESEAGGGGYDRARGTHTSRSARMYPKWVRRSSRSPRRDDPDFPHEGQPRGPHQVPQHSFPVQRRRSSPVGTLNPKAGGPRDHHVPPGTIPLPAAPGQLQFGPWRSGPTVPIQPSFMMGDFGHPVYSDHVPVGGSRPHPSQMVPVQAPPPLSQAGRLVPRPPPNALPQQAQAKHTVSNHNLNGNNNAGPPPTNSLPVLPNGHSIHPATTRAPPPSAPSQSSSASSTPTHAASPNKPPAPQPPIQPAPAPAAIDYRLCIKSRVPGTGDLTEQRMVVRTPLTRAHVRAAALRYVEYNPSLFRHLSPAATSAAAPPADRHLRANVTRVMFGTGAAGGESYDLTTYGEDDLSRLCASVAGGRGHAGELPLFEVVVTNVGPAGSLFTLS